MAALVSVQPAIRRDSGVVRGPRDETTDVQRPLFRIHTAAEADAMAMDIALDRLGLRVTTAVRSGLTLPLFQAGSISIGSVAQIA